MSNPYEKPNLTGYNQNPPPDDGSETSSNLLTWAKHLSKIGNPLRDFASAISDATESAFNRIFGNGIQEISTATTLTDSDQGQIVFVSSGVTVTLPSTSDVGSNWIVLIANTQEVGNTDVTIEGSGSETINGESSINLIPKSYALIISNGTNFKAIRTFTKSLREPFLNGTTTVNFDTWNVASSDRTATVSVQATAQTDSASEGQIDVLLDEDGDDAAERTFRICRVQSNFQDGVEDTSSFTFTVPPGGQYQIRNTSDPNNANSIDQVGEFIH